MKLFLIAALAAVLGSAQTQPPSGAKALFFSPDTGQQTLSSAESTKPVVTGLKYFIELRQPDGKLQQVNATRVFHSGDRIRIHVSTNLDGDLVIYQQQEDLPEERLYPSPEIPGATGHVSRGADVVLPSARGSFRFDEHPGQIRLTLMFTAAHNGAIPSATEAHQLAKAAKGSKALRIEDDSSEDNAEYKVLDSRADRNIPAGAIATEVTLSHAR